MGSKNPEQQRTVRWATRERLLVLFLTACYLVWSFKIDCLEFQVLNSNNKQMGSASASVSKTALYDPAHDDIDEATNDFLHEGFILLACMNSTNVIWPFLVVEFLILLPAHYFLRYKPMFEKQEVSNDQVAFFILLLSQLGIGRGRERRWSPRAPAAGRGFFSVRAGVCYARCHIRV